MTIQRSHSLLIGVAIASFAMRSSQAELPQRDSLYARMGGEPNVAAIVNDLIDQVSTDPKLNRSFDKVDTARVKKLLEQQICQLAGGGCAYEGDSMHDVHAGLGITQAEFYAMVETLRDVMRHHRVGLSERNELLELLAPMKRDVVER